MEVIEISGFRTGVDRSGVDFLEPPDSFDSIQNGYVYRQNLATRKGFVRFGSRILDKTRITGIFEDILPSGEADLLVTSSQFLYVFNSTLNTFHQIPFSESASPFNITVNNVYMSGTTYYKADGSRRFVFTGDGVRGVYFYDGTGLVKSFTSTVDNPEYVAPPGGALMDAQTVRYFGERICFFSPLLGTTKYSQGVLYSGIRSLSNRGEKFNVPGSGILSADTKEFLNGSEFIGEQVAMTFSRSTYILEKTSDAFNPFFIRKIPSVIGTDAPFSTVSWDYEVKSFGKTGMISCDGRQSLRFDNKVPSYTQTEIDPDNFSSCYGGFNRNLSQFLFLHKKIDSIGTKNDSIAVFNYEESTFSFYDGRFSCLGQTTLGLTLTWDDINKINRSSWDRWDTTEELWDNVGSTANKQKTLAGDYNGMVYELDVGFDDYNSSVLSITKGVSTTLSVFFDSFSSGDSVIVENVLGMEEINDKKLSVVSATEVSKNLNLVLNIDSTNFADYVSGGTVSKVIPFSAKLSTFNPWRSNGFRVFVKEVEFLIERRRGTLSVEFFADEEQSPFKTSTFSLSDTNTKKREWITTTVDQEAEFFNIKISREGVNDQIIISSIRIHAKQGGKTSG